tara:strand:+ start:1116 stop:1481 length:366 start_codon:yes stop_codon:yes gene_type:complete
LNERGDYGDKADGWFAALDDSIAPVAADLRSLVRKAVPDATECIKWGTPNYEKDGPICAIRSGKEFVALQFGPIGTSLKDPDGLLEGTGKAMRHVKIRAKTDLKKQLFSSWIKQAATANLK